MNLSHLSDLHFGPKSRFAAMEPERFARGFSQAIRDAATGFGFGSPIDLVVVSGDVAETVHEEEYQQARLFLTLLAAELGVDNRRFVFGPGNHDVDRIACEMAGLRQRKARFNDAELRRQMDEEKLKEYQSFLLQFYGANESFRNQQAAVPRPRLHTFSDQRLSIVSLNSCGTRVGPTGWTASSRANSHCLPPDPGLDQSCRLCWYAVGSSG